MKIQLLIGTLTLASLNTYGNTITVGAVTVSPGPGGFNWDYPLYFANSSVSAAQPSFININDFGGGAVVSTTLPGTFSFTQPLVGLNSGVLGVDDPAIPDAVLTWLSSGPVPDSVYSLVLSTPTAGASGSAQWTTSDIQTAGIAAGAPSAAQGFSRSPGARPAPDNGGTVMLLGCALLSVEAMRERFSRKPLPETP